MTKYPAQIDTSVTLPSAVDNFTPVAGATVNRLRDAVLAIEAELGVKPSGVYGTVRGRLDVLENAAKGVILTQDLGGVFTAPLVVGLQGRPLSSAAPTVGQFIAWDGNTWKPANLSIATDPVATVTANYNVSSTDYVISVGTLSTTVTITLPSTPTIGEVFIIKDTNGSATAHNITIAGNGHNIDSVSSFIINQNYGSLTVIFTGSVWSIV